MVNALSSEDDVPPPFTKLSVPVYSLSSLPGPNDNTGAPTDPTKLQLFNSFSESRPSLNITTYTGPVAIKPERMFMLGLYVGTMSWRNVRQTRKAVLQILTKDLVTPQLFDVLGRKSSRNTNKLPILKEGWKMIDWKGFSVFEGCYGVMLLEVVGDFTACGDHEVVLCKVRGAYMYTHA